MMTEEVQRQLIEWGGLKNDNHGFVRFDSPSGCLFFYVTGKAMYGGGTNLKDWKTIDDINAILDLFCVVRKPIWKVTSNIVVGPNEQSGFLKADGFTRNPEAAERYAAMMNATSPKGESEESLRKESE